MAPLFFDGTSRTSIFSTHRSLTRDMKVAGVCMTSSSASHCPRVPRYGMLESRNHIWIYMDLAWFIMIDNDWWWLMMIDDWWFWIYNIYRLALHLCTLALYVLWTSLQHIPDISLDQAPQRNSTDLADSEAMETLTKHDGNKGKRGSWALHLLHGEDAFAFQRQPVSSTIFVQLRITHRATQSHTI